VSYWPPNLLNNWNRYWHGPPPVAISVAQCSTLNHQASPIYLLSPPSEQSLSEMLDHCILLLHESSITAPCFPLHGTTVPLRSSLYISLTHPKSLQPNFEVDTRWWLSYTIIK
jgi:hypothetical protein